MSAKRTLESARIAGGESGVALISALAMLLFFSILGTAYVSFMAIEHDEAIYESRIVRARHLAEAGVTATVAEIRKSIQADVVPGDTYTYSFPVYVRYGDTEGTIEAFQQEVVVTVEDESRLINLNLAPREVLEAIGMDRAAVRTLKASLPQSRADVEKGKRWLASVNDLRSRGFLASREFAQLDRTLFTVYTAEDPFAPARYININSAPPVVLSALFNVNGDEAEQLTRKRPFATWQDFLEKSGREPNSFNVKPSIQDPHAMPVELDLSSRCYRIHSRATLKPGIGSGMRRGMQREIEAVVLFNDDNHYRFRLWSETPTEFLEIEIGDDAVAEGADDEAPAEDTGAEEPAEEEPSVSGEDAASETPGD